MNDRQSRARSVRSTSRTVWFVVVGLLVLVAACIVVATGGFGASYGKHMTRLADGRVGEKSWVLWASNGWRDGRPGSLCLQLGSGGPASTDSTSECGFGNCGGLCLNDVSTADLFSANLIAGPAPEGTTRVVLRVWCGHHGATAPAGSLKGSKLAAIVATHPLPRWAPRTGRWYLYQSRASTTECTTLPTAYITANGKHLPLGTF